MLYMQLMTPVLDWTLLSANPFESCGGHGNVQLSQSQREKKRSSRKKRICETNVRGYSGRLGQRIAGYSEDDQAEQDADGGHGAQQQMQEEKNVPIYSAVHDANRQYMSECAQPHRDVVGPESSQRPTKSVNFLSVTDMAPSQSSKVRPLCH
jgi:hypothetical protein